MERSLNRIAVRYVLPATQVGCYAGAGYLLGKNVVRAVAVVSYKTGSLAAEFLEKKMTSILWNNSAEEYVKVIKKEVVSDLTKAAGLVAGGILMEKLQDKYNPNSDGYFPEIFNDLYTRAHHYFGDVYPDECVNKFLKNLPAEMRLTTPNPHVPQVPYRCDLGCLKKNAYDTYETVSKTVLEEKVVQQFINSTRLKEVKEVGSVATTAVINNLEYPVAAYLGYRAVKSPYATSRNVFTAASLIILFRFVLGL